MASRHSVEHWDQEADVVVLGSGMAGTVSAVEAFDTSPDAEVLIVEKMPERLKGGSARCSGQFVYAPRPEQIEDLKAYHRALNDSNPIPEDVLDTWAQAVVTQRPWIERMASDVGMKFVHLMDKPPDYPDLPGAWCCEQLYTVEGESGLWRALFANVERRSIPVLYETQAVDLVQDSDTLEIYGVIAEQSGGRLAIKARRGVIVCTGGFAANPAMQRDYCGFDETCSVGGPGNTGDGVRMLQKAGADLWHMQNKSQVGGIFRGMKFPEFESGFLRDFVTASSWIEIAKDNRRFYNEADDDYFSNHFKHELHGHWVDYPFTHVLPVHMIFDEATRVESQLALNWTGWNMITLGYRWSRDNSAEIEKGWIVKADSIRELAVAIDRDQDELEETIARYNRHCAAGHDPDFGRKPERLRPIERPPFYAVELVPAIPATSGGGRRNSDAQVLTSARKPIPRLYEAGELGSTFHNLYQNGSYLTEAIAFGRIAGRNAARESSWVTPLTRAYSS